MKITFSKKKPDGTRDLVLWCDASESNTALDVIRDHVLDKGVRPVVMRAGEDKVKFLFHRSSLDNLIMAFPFADLSPRINKILLKEMQDRLDALPAPELDVPKFAGELYRFQRTGVWYCREQLLTEGVALLNDEMGLGKTIQALATAQLLQADGVNKVLVVTTKSGCSAWARIIRALFPGVKYTVVTGNKQERTTEIRRRRHYTIVNIESIRGQFYMEKNGEWATTTYEKATGKDSHLCTFEALHPELFTYEYDLVIVDEYHKFKNPTAQQTNGYLMLRADKFMVMSGTPFLNNPLETWPTLHRLWPDKFPHFWSFRANLAIMSKGKKKYIVGYKPPQMRKLRDFLVDHSLRRRKDNVGIDMPDVVYTTVPVELTPEQRRLYNKIREEFELLMADGDIKKIIGALPHITRLKQACFSPELYGGSKVSAKIEELRNIVEQLVASGEKAIIFSGWEEGCQILRREFSNYNPAYVTGAVTGTTTVNGKRIPKREAEEDRFNHDPECKLYIGTIRANQEAITLSAATYVIFMDLDWTPLANAQAAARSAAGGLRGMGVSTVHIIELFAEDTFEDRVQELLAMKQDLFNAVIEGRAVPQETRITLRDIRALI